MRGVKTLGEEELLERSSPSPNPTPSQELSHHAPSNKRSDFNDQLDGVWWEILFWVDFFFFALFYAFFEKVFTNRSFCGTIWLRHK